MSCWRVPVRSSQARSIAPIVVAENANEAEIKALLIAYELGSKERWSTGVPVLLHEAGRHPVGVA